MREISMIALTVLAFVCTAGVFHASFRDNWLQFLGMVGITMWCVGRLFRIYHGEPVSEWQLLAHISMACFAAGTAWKFAKFNAAERQAGRELTITERHHMQGPKG